MIRRLIGFAAALMLAGCSVFMAADRSVYRGDPSVIQKGASKIAIEATLGPPDMSTKLDSGKSKSVYKIDPDAHSRGGRNAAVAGHLVMDVLTLGLWEIIGTPVELSAKDKFVTWIITYDRDGNAEDVEVIGVHRPNPVESAPTVVTERATAKPAPNLASTSTLPPSENGARYALVVGNADYRHVARLKNPVNDAKAVSAALRRMDFVVTSLENSSHADLMKSVSEFGDKLKDGDTALFYFSGHAVQVRGGNYLLPVDTRIKSESEVDYLTVNMGYVLAQFERRRSAVNIAILDACRDNPLQAWARNVARGLAVVSAAPSGTIIAYATGPNQIAEDGAGDLGLYTSHLLNHLETPGLKVQDLFNRVAVDVEQATGGRQRPWISGTGISGNFSLALNRAD